VVLIGSLPLAPHIPSTIASQCMDSSSYTTSVFRAALLHASSCLQVVCTHHLQGLCGTRSNLYSLCQSSRIPRFIAFWEVHCLLGHRKQNRVFRWFWRVQIAVGQSARREPGFLWDSSMLAFRLLPCQKLFPDDLLFFMDFLMLDAVQLEVSRQ
jgi:hypothetical protein